MKARFKSRLWLFLLCSLAFSAFTASAAEQSLFVHGDAENVSTVAEAGFYSNAADSSIAADPFDPTGENHVFRIATTGYNWFESKAAVSPLTFASGNAYEFSLRLRIDPDASTTSTYITTYLYSSKTGYINFTNAKYTSNDDWYEIKYRLNADILDPSDTSFEYGLRIDGGGMVLYLDDFCVTAEENGAPEHISLENNTVDASAPLALKVMSPAAGSWVGIFKLSDVPNGNNYNKISWSYTNKAVNGLLTLTAPSEAGNYLIHYFANGGYTPVENILLSVKQPKLLSLNKDAYLPGEKMTITYRNAASTQAWVCLYIKGSRPGDGSPDMKTWKYVPNAGNGTMEFNAPNDLGEYTAFLLKDGGYTVVEQVDFSVRKNAGEPTAPKTVSFEPTENASAGYADGVMKAAPGETVNDGVLFYWGDENGILADYTYIGYGSYNAYTKEYTYVPTAGNLIPSEATRLYARGVMGTSNDVESGTARLSEQASYSELNVAKLSLGKLLYSFEVISDLHTTINYGDTKGQNILAAFADIAANRKNSIGVFTAGDNVDLGKPEEYDVLRKYITDSGLADMPFFFTVGNHEFYYEQIEGAATGAFFTDNWKRFREFADWNENEYYRYKVIDGDYFIFMGEEARGTTTTPGQKQGTADGYYSAAQREWLRGLLRQAASENAQAFVFMHQSIDNTVAGSFIGQNWSGINDDELMKEIIESYPNTTLFTGHSHWSLHSNTPFVNGAADGASYVNTASCGYLWSDANAGIPGSEGLSVEVYENYILVRGRDFLQQKWCPAVNMCVPKNTTFTAQDVPSVSEQTSLRFSGVNGIRFKAVVGKELVFNSDTLGFMVTRDKFFRDSTICGGEDSRFILANQALNAPGRLSTGTAYNAEQKLSKLQDDGENDFFTAVVCGIPQKAEYYTEPLHVRAYVTCGGVTYYGNVRSTSLYDAALAYRAAHPEDQENAYIQAILETVEGANP